MPRRSTRAATARNYQSREANAREIVAQEAQGVLWYDPRKVPAGMKYGWICRAVNNEENAYNIRTRQMSGWKAVPSERHPEFSTSGWGLPSETQRSYIEIAGLILCEIPQRVYDRNKQAQNLLAFAATQMPHVQEMGDQTVSKLLPMVDIGAGSSTTLESVTMERAKELFKD